MPNIYISRQLYDELVRRGEDVTRFVAEAVKEALSSKKPKTERR